MLNKISLILLIQIIPLFLKGQDVLSSIHLNSSGNMRPLYSTIDNDNNVYILGDFSGTISFNNLTSLGGTDLFVAKIDSINNVKWIKRIGGPSNEIAAGIIVNNNSIVVAGTFSNKCVFSSTDSIISGGGNDILIAKYDIDGNLIWGKSGGTGSTNQRAYSLKFQNDNFILLGIFYSSINFSTFSLSSTRTKSFFLTTFDSNGIAASGTHYDFNNNSSVPYSFEIGTDGYYVAGHFKDSLIINSKYKSLSSSLDFFITKLDFTYSEQWTRIIAGNSDDYATSISLDQNSNVYFGGHFYSPILVADSTSTLKSSKLITNKGNLDIVFGKYNSLGTLQWIYSAGSTGDDRLYRALTRNKTFLVAGQYSGELTVGNKTINSIGGSTDIFGIAYDSNDNLVYLFSLGGTGTDIGETALIDKKGLFSIIGDFTSSTISVGNNSINRIGSDDLLVVKYDKGSLNKTITPITCHGASTGEIDLTPEGTVVAPYTYQWSKTGGGFSSSQSSITGLSAGTYKVTFTDAVGYQKTDSVILTEPPAMIISERIHQNTSCNQSLNGVIKPAVTGGTGTYTYLWSGTGSGIFATDSIQTALSAGTYSLSVTDANGCQSSLSNLVITQPDKITFNNTVATKINGHHGSVVLSVQGGTPVYTYSWSGPAGFTATTQDISNLTDAGDYTVTVTDQNLCQADTSFLIADINNMYAYVVTKTGVSCKGGSNGEIVMAISNTNTTPSYSYAWSGPNGFTANTLSVSGLAAGVYTATITDTDPNPDKVYVVPPITVDEPVTALAVTANANNITCFGLTNGFIDVNPNGGIMPYTYQWTKNGSAMSETSEVISGLTEASYSVTVTDANNCAQSISASIVEPSPVTVNSAVVTSLTCAGTKNDGAINLNISGGTGAYSFKWSNGLTSQNISLLSAGTYRCTITDVNDCAATTQQTVSAPANITASFNNTNVYCFGGNDGAINLTPTGGNAGAYTFLWSNNATTEDISGLSAGTYSVTISDSKNCEKAFATNLIEPSDIALSSSNVQNISCNGQADGSISLNTSGGTTPYIWVWSNNKTTSVVTGLTAGSYSVTVTDNHNCTKNASYQITEPTALSISEVTASHVNVKCNGLSDGAIEVTASGSSGVYEYSADGAVWQSSPVFTNLVSGDYALSVRDKNSTTCLKSLTPAITISQPSAITFNSPVTTDITCFGLTNGSLTAVASGGTGLLSYVLKLDNAVSTNTSGNANGSYTGLSAGTGYVVEVTDASGCGPVVTNPLNIVEPPAITIISQDTTLGIPNKGKIEVVATGGTGALSYSNNGGTPQATGLFTDLPNGTYKVTVTDANSCGPVESISLLINTATINLDGGSIGIYPNPATDRIFLDVRKLNFETLTLELKSITGQAIFTQQYKNVNENLKEAINVGDLPKGIYLIRVNNVVLKEKLIVQ